MLPSSPPGPDLSLVTTVGFNPDHHELPSSVDSTLSRQVKVKSSSSIMLSSSPIHIPQSCPSIEYDKIVKATENFNESLLVGHGSFGKVYRGSITFESTSVVAAIELLDRELFHEPKELWVAAKKLSELRHSNIVSVFGYCEHEEGKIFVLVYEYMSNKTLYDHLHKYRTPLSWIQRLNICIDAARGLSYLHYDTFSLIDSGIIHGSISSSHILFNEKWEAKLLICQLLEGNQLSTSVIGNVGYSDPEYNPTRAMSRKSDEYAFGMLMLEVLTRKHDYEEGMGLLMRVKDFMIEGNLKHIVDPDVRDEISPKCLKKFVSIANRCLDKDLSLRPTLAEVVANLEAVRVESSSSIMSSSSSSIHSQQSCSSIEYHEIVKATKDFNESLSIDRGSFGKVYKGNITIGSNSVFADITRMDPELIHEKKEIWAAVNVISDLHHPNIVSLIGYCFHEQEIILVYEYMQDATLYDHLHKNFTPLSWIQRLKICIDAARGLHYLHYGAGVKSGIIHGVVSSSNILFRENWVAKLSDFGFSLKRNQLSTYDNTCVICDIGYLDPVYFETGKLRRMSDVYSFGVLMLEMLCRKPVSGEDIYGEGMNLVMWAKAFIKKGNLKHITDPDIRDEISPKCLKKFVNIAKRCLDKDLILRPTMAEVVANLEAVRVEPSSSITSSSSSSIHSPQSCSSIEYHEIVKATKDFNELLSIERGSIGKVYKGNITIGSNSVYADITRMDPGLIHETKEIRAAVNVISELRHSNIVSLIGYCFHEQEIILVYEYMHNATLYDHLHKHFTPLSWIQRLKICVDAARGLHYLHYGADVKSGIIHGNVSSSNILFRENWVAKLSDFGFSLKRNQLSTYDNTCIIGDIGYLDPVYFETGKLRRMSDVYSFGVLMLEMLCRKPVSGEDIYGEGMNLVMWAKAFIRKGNLKHITDPDIRDEISPKCLKKFVSIAKRCLDKDLILRPTMAEVVANLEAVLDSQEKFNGSKQRRFRSLLTAGMVRLATILLHPKLPSLSNQYRHS
ncbi:putative protein kinase RLK-Pelle-CrRLK1L-1 family [Helianthus annuus]|nr:putative protein kinase RLK-Pelle-CrRLK1L-1 family [Helianthus annuus]